MRHRHQIAILVTAFAALATARLVIPSTENTAMFEEVERLNRLVRLLEAGTADIIDERDDLRRQLGEAKRNPSTVCPSGH